VLPRLVEMEKEYGSLTRGMLAGTGRCGPRQKKAEKASGSAAAHGKAMQGTVNAGGNGRPGSRSIFTTLRVDCSSWWMRLRRGSIGDRFDFRRR